MAGRNVAIEPSPAMTTRWGTCPKASGQPRLDQDRWHLKNRSPCVSHLSSSAPAPRWAWEVGSLGTPPTRLSNRLSLLASLATSARFFSCRDPLGKSPHMRL